MSSTYIQSDSDVIHDDLISRDEDIFMFKTDISGLLDNELIQMSKLEQAVKIHSAEHFRLHISMTSKIRSWYEISYP